MAIIKFPNRKNQMGINTLKESIKYVSSDKKTQAQLMTGINCTAETAFEEMKAVKIAYGKTDGRQHMHFIQSFSPDDPVTAEMAHEIGRKLVEETVPKDFQCLIATHVDRDHIHNHILINSVNMKTGLKWKQGREFLLLVRQKSDGLCREYGLSVLEGKRSQDKMPLRGEYEAAQDGRSWKHELRLAVNSGLAHATSREDFISKLKKLGYDVVWTDERKHVTFITPDGKRCRGRMLGSGYAKEDMLQRFEKNRAFHVQHRYDIQFALLGELVNSIRNLQNTDFMDEVNASRFPLSALEGQAKREKVIELSSKGLDWDSWEGR